MNLIENKNIAIIGGGPGGLTLARLLQNVGAKVKVYERDLNKETRRQGATLDLHEESGLKALEEAGLMAEFWANFRPGADKLRIVDKHANIFFEDTDHDSDNRNRPEIDRGPLQNILLNSLQPNTVVWDSQFVNMTQQNSLWKLNFKNGTSAYADLVIAADGANSKLRTYITSIKLYYVGITAIEGAVQNSLINCPTVHNLLKGGKIFAMDDEKTLIVASKGDGSLVFYPGFKTDENWIKTCGINFENKSEVLNWFKQEYEGWDDIWSELFENATSNFIPRPQYCMPLDQTWESLPNLTMLGDAAHLMPPYAGEGVNMAMLDALELSQRLTNKKFSSLQEAIASFEKQMRTRATQTAQQTLYSTFALHSDKAIPFFMGILSTGADDI